MVKGGTKRKATMEKITKRESAATTFSKRTYGLHSKISQLCLLTDAQIAVLATPPSANSNVSFFSFGHSSVDSIVTAFLTGQKPVREARLEDDHQEDLGICLAKKELGLPQWWEDDALLKTKNPQELNRAINSISRLLMKINELRADDAEPPLKKQKNNYNNNETMKKTEPTEQTLVFPSGSSSNNTSEQDDKTLDYNNNNVMTEEEPHHNTMSTGDSFCLPHNNTNNESSDVDFDQLIDLDFDFDFDSINSFDNNNQTMKMTEPLDQPLIFSSSHLI